MLPPSKTVRVSLPEVWSRAGELNATRMAYEASMTPVHLPARKHGPGSWGRTSGLSIIDRVLNHAELFPDGAPCQIRTGFSGLQVRRIATYAYRACDCGANGANRTLIGCLPCNCSATDLRSTQTWRQRRELNASCRLFRPMPYLSATLARPGGPPGN